MADRWDKCLVDSQIKSAKRTGTAYTLRDGRNLFVVVREDGKKYFQFRFYFDGKQRAMQLGPWPKTSLATAREDADKWRKVMQAGKNPAIERRLEKRRGVAERENTFAKVAAEWLEDNKEEWTQRNYERQESVLRRFLLPKLGPLPVTMIDTPMVRGLLKEIEARGRLVSAREARTTASMIFTKCTHDGLLEKDPAATLSKSLNSRRKVNHHASLKFEEIGPMLRALSQSTVEPITQAAIRLVLLLVLRDNSLRSTAWAHIDPKEGLWFVPAANNIGRLHKKKDYVTPIPPQALAILHELHKLTGESKFVFAGPGKSGHMSATTISNAIQRLGFNATAHGMRSLFKDWGREGNKYPQDFIEAQLAHSWGHLQREEEGGKRLSNATADAYQRTQFVNDRRRMLEHWANVVEMEETGKAPRDVIGIRSAEVEA